MGGWLALPLDTRLGAAPREDRLGDRKLYRIRSVPYEWFRESGDPGTEPDTTSREQSNEFEGIRLRPDLNLPPQIHKTVDGSYRYTRGGPASQIGTILSRRVRATQAAVRPQSAEHETRVQAGREGQRQHNK